MSEYLESVVGFSGRVTFRAGRRGRLRSQHRRVSLLVTLLSVFFIANASGSVHHIWAVNDGEKVERDDLNNPNKQTNSAWDGRKIKIFGACNEIIAFQLIIEADKDGVNRTTVALPEMVQKGGQGRISYKAPEIDPTDYVGRPIQLFSVNYMNVELPSHAEWVYQQGSPAAPKDPTGWKPVQLVPENARAERGGFPFKIAPDLNQAVWIEVYTAKSLPAGKYTGNVIVTADNQKK